MYYSLGKLIADKSEEIGLTQLIISQSLKTDQSTVSKTFSSKKYTSIIEAKRWLGAMGLKIVFDVEADSNIGFFVDIKDIHQWISRRLIYLKKPKPLKQPEDLKKLLDLAEVTDSPYLIPRHLEPLFVTEWLWNGPEATEDIADQIRELHAELRLPRAGEAHEPS